MTILDVFIFPKSIFFKCLQSLNIDFIVVTYEKSKLDKSISIILLKPKNIFSQEFILSLKLKIILFISDSRLQYFLQSFLIRPLTITKSGSL